MSLIFKRKKRVGLQILQPNAISFDVKIANKLHH